MKVVSANLLKVFLLFTAAILASASDAEKIPSEVNFNALMYAQNTFTHLLESTTQERMYLQGMEIEKSPLQLVLHISPLIEECPPYDAEKYMETVREFFDMAVEEECNQSTSKVIFLLTKSISSFQPRILQDPPHPAHTQLLEIIKYIAEVMEEKQKVEEDRKFDVNVTCPDYTASLFLQVVEALAKNEVVCKVHLCRSLFRDDYYPNYMGRYLDPSPPTPEEPLRSLRTKENVDAFQEYVFKIDVSISPKEGCIIELMGFTSRIPWVNDMKIVPATLLRVLKSKIFKEFNRVLVTFSALAISQGDTQAVLQIPIYLLAVSPTVIRSLDINVSERTKKLRIMGVEEESGIAPVSLEKLVLKDFMIRHKTQKQILKRHSAIRKHISLAKAPGNMVTVVEELNLCIFEEDFEEIDIEKSPLVVFKKIKISGHFVKVLQMSPVFDGTIESVRNMFEFEDSLTFAVDVKKYTAMVLERFPDKKKEEVHSDLRRHIVIYSAKENLGERLTEWVVLRRNETTAITS